MKRILIDHRLHAGHCSEPWKMVMSKADEDSSLVWADRYKTKTMRANVKLGL